MTNELFTVRELRSQFIRHEHAADNRNLRRERTPGAGVERSGGKRRIVTAKG